jgi:4-carboxymuconolactone decarboxylase
MYAFISYLCTMKTICKILIAVAMIATCDQIKAQKNMVLTERQQGLVTIAALEAKGDLTGLSKAVNEGLDNGMTVNEIKEALSQLYAYTGFPRSLNGLGTLQAVIKDRTAKGLKTEEGRDADPLPADYDALKQGTEVQTQLTGVPFNYTFAPATDYYLKAHLFGDIFARNSLSYADREIVTVSAIAALPGCEPQLKAHVNGARHFGVKDDEIHAIPAVLEEKVGATEAYRARKAIAEVFGETFDEGAPIDGQLFPKGNLNTAYAKYFIGNSYLAGLANGGGKLPIANVTFEPRCRNNWHIHHKGGQILICVGGRGWYQEWGKAPRELHPGDVVDIPAEVKHWHGAAKDSWFQHIAIGVPAEGASAEWLEPVTDAEYDKLQ